MTDTPVRIPLTKLRKAHPDKPDGCLRCRYFLDCKSYKIESRIFQKGRAKSKTLLLVAMNPGQEEDQNGEILIGPSGKLLAKYVEEYLSDHIVYVTNAVKCYIPPDNFNKKGEIPLANIRYCSGFLKEDIERIKPDLIVGLGRIACLALDVLGVEYTRCHHPSFILHGGDDSFTRDVLTRVDAELSGSLVKIPYGEPSYSKYGVIGLDFEWDYETGVVHTIGIADIEKCYSLPMSRANKNLVAGLLADPHLTIVGHDLARAEVQKILELGITNIKCQFMDTIILLRELIDNKGEQALKDFAYRHLLIEDYTRNIPKDVEYKDYMKSYSEDVARICAGDAWTSLYLWDCLANDWKEEYTGMTLAREVDMEMILPTAVMMHKGIGLDLAKVEEHRHKLVDLVPQLAESFRLDYDGVDVGSPGDVKRYLQTMGCKVPDTTKESLQKIQEGTTDLELSRFIDRVLDYRQKSKLVSTYLRPLPELMDKNGVIHSYIQIAGANNGRPTSSSPNIANIPRRDYNMKDIFCSKFGEDGVLATLDASESEFRHFAYLSQDEWLIENYRKGIGMHDTVSREVGISRDDTKTLNFARLYYATRPKLKSVLLDAGLKGRDLDRKLDKYLEATQSMTIWQEKIIKESYDQGYVLSPDGRRGYRLTPNTIANYPVSSFSSYSNKRRLVWLFSAMRAEDMASHIWMDYYDGIELDIYLPELDRIKEIIQDMDCTVPDILDYGIDLPLPVEFKIHGRNWK